MPAPERVDHPSKLSDEALYCHCYGHHWWVSGVKKGVLSIRRVPQDRQYYACANGCGTRKRCLIDTEDGNRWGWSMVPGEKYGTTGGWNKEDFIYEWLRRDKLGTPLPVEFEFNGETFSVEKKQSQKRGKVS